MNDSRCLLQEFHTLVNEYGGKLPMTTMYKDSLLRRIEAELTAPLPEGREQVLEDAAKACERKAAGFALEGTVKETSYTQQQQAQMAFWQSDGLRIAAGIVRELKRHSPQEGSQ